MTATQAPVKPARLIWQMLMYRKWLYFADVAAWAAIHTFPLIPGFILREFFNTLAGASSLGLSVNALIALVLASALAQVMLRVAGALADIPHRFIMSALLRRNTFAHILNLPGAASVHGAVGDVFNVMRDDARSVEDFISWTCDLVGQSFFLPIALVILVSINAPMALLVFLPMVAVVTISQLAWRKIARLREARRNADGDVADCLNEMFESVNAIQVATAEERFVDHFRKLSEARREAAVKDSVFTQLVQSIYENAVQLGTGLILLVAAGAMQPGQARPFTVGDFALFVYYLTFVSDMTVFYGRVISTYRQTHVAFKRMIGLLQGAPPETLVAHNPIGLKPRDMFAKISSAPGVLNARSAEALTSAPSAASAQSTQIAPPFHALRVSSLTYQHPTSQRGIQNVNLELNRGEFVVITGRIGSGKTTLVRALLGLLKAQSGDVYWNGEIVRDPANFFVPPRTAYTPQSPRLFSNTLRDNIRLGFPASDDEVRAAMRQAVLEDDVNQFEKQLDTLIGPRGVRLSGGQAQRTAAARMFVRRPDVLVFDDLSSALDVVTEQTLWQRLDDARAQGYAATCLVVSHRRAALHRADRILVLKDGAVAEVGPHSQLYANNGEYRSLYDARTE